MVVFLVFGFCGYIRFGGYVDANVLKTYSSLTMGTGLKVFV